MLAYQNNSPVFLTIASCCFFGVAVVLHHHRRALGMLRTKKQALPYSVLGAAFVLSATVSTLIDFEFVNYGILFVLEEMAELSAGLALTFASMYGYQRLAILAPAERTAPPPSVSADFSRD